MIKICMRANHHIMMMACPAGSQGYYPEDREVIRAYAHELLAGTSESLLLIMPECRHIWHCLEQV
jgi:hypothetical protein